MARPKISTTVTSAHGNGGVHSTKQLKTAWDMLRNCTYKRARLYHICFTGATQVEPYREANDELIRKLRKKTEVQWKGAVEVDSEDDDESKGLHFHVFILIDAFSWNPDHILNRKVMGDLYILTAKHGITFKLNEPRDPIHRAEDGSQLNYATLPPSKPEKLANCLNWISYLYKRRTKSKDIKPTYYSSRAGQSK